MEKIVSTSKRILSSDGKKASAIPILIAVIIPIGQKGIVNRMAMKRRTCGEAAGLKKVEMGMRTKTKSAVQMRTKGLASQMMSEFCMGQRAA
jgi:hypothetical protein